MLTAEGCRQRRLRLWERLEPATEGDHLRLADPIHLMYLANFSVDPFSLGAGFGGVLLLRKDGQAKLIHDNRLPHSVDGAHVEECTVVPWYDGQAPARGPRQLALLQSVNPTHGGLRIHDRPGDPYAATVVQTLADMRRQKDPDEIALLRQCMRATEAGHAWARANVKPGLTELDVYRGVSSACIERAGHAVIVYGDFAVSPGFARRGGPPTDRVLEPGDMLILDFSVVIAGYRSDFTNTLVVGKEPTADQQRLYELCIQAMAAGERELRAGQPCLTVYEAVRDVFGRAGVAGAFPHHAGHGLGLTHPEAPYFVREANETLRRRRRHPGARPLHRRHRRHPHRKQLPHHRPRPRAPQQPHHRPALRAGLVHREFRREKIGKMLSGQMAQKV